MPITSKAKADLGKKFQKIEETPASFAFFEAIHDFVKHIELNPTLASSLSPRFKPNRELRIQSKYEYLKQIYQGLEDSRARGTADLGHTRYAIVNELNKIRNNDVSESNSFWKRRELSRKLAREIYRRINPDIV